MRVWPASRCDGKRAEISRVAPGGDSHRTECATADRLSFLVRCGGSTRRDRVTALRASPYFPFGNTALAILLSEQEITPKDLSTPACIGLGPIRRTETHNAAVNGSTAARKRVVRVAGSPSDRGSDALGSVPDSHRLNRPSGSVTPEREAAG